MGEVNRSTPQVPEQGQASVGIPWEQILQYRSTPQWTEQDEQDLHQSIQAGDIPQDLAAKYPRVVGQQTRQPTIQPLAPLPIADLPQNLTTPSLPTTPPSPGGREAVPPFQAVHRPFPHPSYPTERQAALAQEYPAFDWLFRDYGPELSHLMAEYVGPNLLKYGPPVVVGLLTRKFPYLTGHLATATTAGGAQFLAETQVETPAPGTPEARGEWTPALQRAARTTMEVGGAGVGSRLIAPARAATALPSASGLAPLKERVARGVAQTATTAAGAGVGSLLAEPLTPSEHPWRTALGTAESVAEWDAAFKLGGVLIRQVFGPARMVTGPGRHAADTLLEYDIPTPATVTDSNIMKFLETGGQAALFQGSKLRYAVTLGKEKLTQGIESLKALGSLPPDQAVLAALRQRGYRPGASDAAKATQQAARDRLYADVQDLATIRMYQSGLPTTIPSTVQTLAGTLSLATTHPPVVTALSRLNTHPTLTPQQALQQYRTIERYVRQSTLPDALATQFDTLLVQLRDAMDHPISMTLRGVKQAAEQLRTEVSGMTLPEVTRILNDIAASSNRVSLKQAMNTRSQFMAIARSMETGGAMRAPTATGQAPEAGTGREMAPRVQRQAKALADSIETQIEQQMGQYGTDIYPLYRVAQNAQKASVVQQTLEDFFGGADVYNTSEGVYNGKAILDKIRNVYGSREKFQDAVGTEVVTRIERLAHALGKLQEANEASPAGTGHQVTRWLIRAMQPAAFTGGVFTGHPGVGLTAAMIPEAMAFIMRSPQLSHFLSVGLNPSTNVKTAWKNLGQLMGALQEAGFGPFTSALEATGVVERAPSASPPPSPLSARQETALRTYTRELSDPNTTEDQARQFWELSMRGHTDVAAKTAYREAFYQRFRRRLTE